MGVIEAGTDGALCQRLCFRRSWLWSTGTRSFICLHYHPFPPWGHLPGHWMIKRHKRVDSLSVIIHPHTLEVWKAVRIYSKSMKTRDCFLCNNPSKTSCRRGRGNIENNNKQYFVFQKAHPTVLHLPVIYSEWWVTAWELTNGRWKVWQSAKYLDTTKSFRRVSGLCCWIKRSSQEIKNKTWRHCDSKERIIMTIKIHIFA